MTRYFANPKLADTFYGQPVDSAGPVTEFEVIGSTRHLITAARVPTDARRIRTIHIFNRHTGRSDDGLWGHVASFRKPWFPGLSVKGKRVAIAWISFLTIAAICVLIATWRLNDS